ncbi:hypothetical protein MTBBW1_1380022 [Desulfamplus magnetovallimortis]|uniref:Uncharacterized protein n=1 Tax=Desulfamplus magnetovallimortis TaxID=1246637 RepID=A0A1W1H7W4_9BACT|nr:hypothetical protein MTBBW1_1380022 [Desulfamplus magnetovallimortis]
MDLRFFNADINDLLPPIEGDGNISNSFCAAKSPDGFNTTKAVLLAAALRNFLLVTSDIVLP